MEVTSVVEFVIGIIGRIISSMFSTYPIRFLDTFWHKNNRHGSK